MKKALQIYAIALVYLLAAHLVLLGIHFAAPNFNMESGLAALVEEAPLLLIFLFLNRRIWQQKILWAKYPLIKGIGLIFMAWFYVILLIVAFATRSFDFLDVLLIFAGYLVVGITEEYVFRGVIFGRLISAGKSLPVAITVSSLLFGLTHLLNLTRQAPLLTGVQVLNALLFGVLAATIYLKSNNLIYPIVLHALNDITISLITLPSAQFSHTESAMSSSPAVIASALIIVLFLFLIYYSSIIIPYLATGKKQIVAFYARLLGNEINISEKATAVVHQKKNSGWTISKILAIIGAAIYTLIPIQVALQSISMISDKAFQDGFLAGMKAGNSQSVKISSAELWTILIGLLLFVVLAFLVFTIINWLAAFRTNTKGWQIYLLIIGILTILISPALEFYPIVSGLLFILSFVLRNKRKA